MAASPQQEWRAQANQYHAAVARGRHPTSFTRRDNALWKLVREAEQLRKDVCGGHTLWRSASAQQLPHAPTPSALTRYRGGGGGGVALVYSVVYVYVWAAMNGAGRPRL